MSQEFGPPTCFAPHAPRLQRRTRVHDTHALRSSYAAKRLACGDVPGGYLFECVFVIQSAVAQGMIDLLHFLVEVLNRTLRP
jgi:hypothetical protein